MMRFGQTKDHHNEHTNCIDEPLATMKRRLQGIVREQ